MTTAQNPTFSSDQAAADFYPLPRLKSALKGGRLCDATEIIKNATKELKRLSQNGFEKCFPTQMYSRWQRCIAVQGEYFEGNVA